MEVVRPLLNQWNYLGNCQGSLRDLANRQEPGWFYEKELSKVVIDRHEKHRVERIVRQRKVQGRLQHLVRWAGYPSNYDSWEWADELQK